MKYNKGMWLDGKPSQNPLDTTRINKNVIFDRSKGATINEPGNRLVEAYGTDKSLVGIITLDSNDFVVFTRKGDTSEIGYIDSTLSYKILSNDNAYDLRPEYPVHGEFQRNPQGEVVIVWTDTRQTHYMNLSKSFTAATTSLFYTGYRPDINNLTVMTGGVLKAGAYYIILSFEKHDYSTTDWFKSYNPVVITGASPIAGSGFNTKQPNEITDKLISFEVSYNNNDNVFKRLRVGVISTINQTNTAFIVKTIDVLPGSNNLNVVIDGNEITTPITLDEVLIDIPRYEKADHITQMQSTLYLAGLAEYKEPSHQSKLNNLEFVFKSEIPPITSGHKDPYYYINRKTFGHGEVYALYIRFRYKWGNGRWYHIPGREANPGDKDIVDIPNDYSKYQLDDTCTYNFGIGEGQLSFWENKNEAYPTNGEYPAGNVRHFKFPSLRWMKENVYASIGNFGNGVQDILSLKLKTTIDLNNFKDCNGETPVSFELGYAKHTIENGLNVGQSIAIFASRRDSDFEEFGNTSLGANFNMLDWSFDTRVDNQVRVYPPEMLFSKTLYNPTHIRLEVQTLGNLYFQRPFIEDGEEVRPIGAVAMYTSNSTIPTQELIKVTNSDYLINNTIKGNTNNTYLEDTVLISLDTGIIDVPVKNILSTEIIAKWNSGVKQDTDFPVLLVTLLQIKHNCYFDFTNQTIIPGDSEVNNYTLYGDMYINYFNSMVTYGLSPRKNKYSTDTSVELEDPRHTPLTGLRIMNVYTFESFYNLNLRYENADKLGGYTLFFQFSTNVLQLSDMRADQEPNQINRGYSLDYNAQNTLAFQNVYNPNSLYNEQFPYRVIKGLSPNSDDLTFSGWTKFLDANKHELPRDKGRLVHLDSGADYLLFHFENSLLTTRPSGRLETGGQTIFLGIGNIFEHEAVEVIHDQLGALGTRHKWSCKMTKYGYVWVDDIQACVYLFNKSVDILSNKGLYNFFLNHALTIGDNPFIGNGYHIVLDEENKRFIITRKHLVLNSEMRNNFKGVWKSDQTFLDSLSPGDIIYKDGTYKQVK